jgi:hypothetical protein
MTQPTPAPIVEVVEIVFLNPGAIHSDNRISLIARLAELLEMLDCPDDLWQYEWRLGVVNDQDKWRIRLTKPAYIPLERMTSLVRLASDLVFGPVIPIYPAKSASTPAH